MFGIVADLIAIVTTILFPVFASYKALRTSDPAQLTPWLMYWVVLSLFLMVESFFDFILAWVPFYSWMRLLVHLYLVMPGKQGATQLYQDYLDPFLTQHELEIENFIGDAHEKAKTAGWKYAKQAIEYVRVNILGMPPQPPTPPPSRGGTYAQALLSRFAMPSARPSGGSGPAGDIYNLLSQALTSATALYGSREAQAENLSASGTLIPRDVPAEERSSYVDTQRERLRVLLQAFDREAYVLASEPERRSGERLPKSRSDTDFDRIEVDEVDDRDRYDDRYGDRYRERHSDRTPGSPDERASWMPWNWGGGRPNSRGSDSGEERRRGYRDSRDERDERRGKSSGLDYPS